MSLKAVAHDPEMMARGLGLFDEPTRNRVVVAARKLQPRNVTTIEFADPKHAYLSQIFPDDRRQGYGQMAGVGIHFETNLT